ncbi:transposase [Dolichospermum compactum NIES-806]|uniref:Transposase n=1 Tax=Dolichospermum compactum NIES-806 TaxID=1973481 RepID=A0A1Z4UY51_9CYAN|nr:transposase [Dolichospermum compactum NIES-806]
MNFLVLEFNGEGNHVHALIEYPAKLSVSQIVNALKGVSSRRYGQAGYKTLLLCAFARNKIHHSPNFSNNFANITLENIKPSGSLKRNLSPTIFTQP